MLQQLERRGCTLIDTTCGSVLNVWKNVRRYAEGGYTSIIHGKVWHEETQATASQAVEYGGRYLVVFDDAEAEVVCDYIRQRRRPRRASWRASAAPSRPGFDPDRDLQRIGLANQTTMLMSESLEIGEMLQGGDARPLRRRATRPTHFQAFDTICSATQDRQDAVVALLREHAGRPDDRHRRLQQQQHLQPGAHLRRRRGRRSTSPIPTASCRPTRSAIGRSAPRRKTTAEGWLPRTGPVTIGLTSGASTPDNLVGAAIARLEAFCA